MSPSEARLLQPRILIPFIIVTLIWGSTWTVIRDQLGEVPPTWSVTYRFLIAAAAMFAYAVAKGWSLRIGARGHALAAAFGLPQFFLNFNFVYWAEQYVTSGLVAVVFTMLLIPNAVLGRLFLDQRIPKRFVVGSAVAMLGVAMLFLQEIRTTSLAAGAVLLGIGLTLAGVLSASISNVMQASANLRDRPIPSMIAWGMAYGVLANALVAFFVYGPPVIEYRVGYWAGLIYLGLFASALAFTFYFEIIRAIGPGRAAYSSLLVPIIAMALSTIFEGYRWSLLAAAGVAIALVGLFIALNARTPKTPLETVPEG